MKNSYSLEVGAEPFVIDADNPLGGKGWFMSRRVEDTNDNGLKVTKYFPLTSDGSSIDRRLPERRDIDHYNLPHVGRVKLEGFVNSSQIGDIVAEVHNRIIEETSTAFSPHCKARDYVVDLTGVEGIGGNDAVKLCGMLGAYIRTGVDKKHERNAMGKMRSGSIPKKSIPLQDVNVNFIVPESVRDEVEAGLKDLVERYQDDKYISETVETRKNIVKGKYQDKSFLDFRGGEAFLFEEYTRDPQGFLQETEDITKNILKRAAADLQERTLVTSCSSEEVFASIAQSYRKPTKRLP